MIPDRGEGGPGVDRGAEVPGVIAPDRGPAPAIAKAGSGSAPASGVSSEGASAAPAAG